jgi:hypothetical protein
VKVKQTLTVAAVVAAAAVPSADAASVSQLVKKAHGKPYACDVDHDGRWGQKQLQCVIIVVMPSRWERWGLRVAKCESGGDHYVAAPPPNPSSGARGLFQFLPSTWDGTPQYKAAYRVARRAGSSPSRARRHAAGKVNDPVRNTQGAKWLVSTSGPSQWSCK